MNFLEKLNFLMERYALNKRTLSQKSKIPYTTIDNWYKRGYEGLKIPTLCKLSDFFNTTLDHWVVDEITDPNYGKSSGFKVEYEEMEHIKSYRKLDVWGKERIDHELNKELERVEQLQAQQERIDALEAGQTKVSGKIQSKRMYTYVRRIACAGEGFYFDDIPTETIEAPYMEGADFIIGVNGDSMEPDYLDGDKVYVKKASHLNLGDVGIFTVGNECYIKEFGKDGLISRNKDYEGIPGTEDVRLIGKVIGKMQGE